MGRTLLVGDTFGGAPRSYSLLDLLHFSSAGVRDFDGTVPGYFSTNGGDTNQGAFNTLPSGDFGDWASSVTNNPFDAFGSPGVAEVVTANDLAEVDAIGWNATGAATAPAPTGSGAARVSHPTSPLVPVNLPHAESATGLSFTPDTQYLMLADGAGGWTGGSPLATIAGVGAIAGDALGYTLSGTRCRGLSSRPPPAMRAS